VLYRTGEPVFLSRNFREGFESIKVYLHLCERSVRKYDASMACPCLDTELAEAFPRTPEGFSESIEVGPEFLRRTILAADLPYLTPIEMSTPAG